MTEAARTHIDDNNWEIPTYREEVFKRKHYKHALVIPVINEGDRIRGQLLRIKDANLSVDVIVADGGSSDGALEKEFMNNTNVRAILTKTGQGKLSAQLRVAYAWCIRQGYSGIVTIDGNGKDGIHAISDMIAKLEQGYDYIQGSRYLPGGVSENTPLERTIANRLVHAPMLSLAGKHWFSDTTNGFRAYSTSYLLDPRVKPFRNVFQNYELLFYLTVRAGQIGRRVTETAVERRYPPSEATPTKIDSFSKKLELFHQTLLASFSKFNPK